MKERNFFDIFCDVRKEKILELKNRIEKLGIDLSDIEEKFIKGSGKGGQKKNKTNNTVFLKYHPLNICVKYGRTRSLSLNRFLALRMLVEKIEERYLRNPSLMNFFKKGGLMPMILEGKTLSENISNETRVMCEEFLRKYGRKPSLAIVNYFENSPSAYYMNIKVKKSLSLGIDTKVYTPENKTDKKYFLSLIEKLGADDSVDAIMVEKPLPDGFDDKEFWDILNPSKDVDCLSSVNMGKLFITRNFSDIESSKFFVPQTANACIKLMKYYGIDVRGKNAVVVGRSSIVGKPLAIMLSLLDATVTICHSKTREIEKHLKFADIIFTAIGKARFIKANMIGENQIIIDIGTNFDENGKICGDVDFDGVREKVSAITPVPGGVGPVTLSLLLNAVVKAAYSRVGSER
jgi:methylenetetrahydrofolate dehydrogenase (NADP+)/methenyltetrahydrofolate cyclohydrolase